MDKKFVLFGILASILMAGSSGIFLINDSFADDNLSVSKEDSEAYKKQLEKDKERKEKLEEKQNKQKLKAEERKEKLEEKQNKQKLKAEERLQELEKKRDEYQQKAEEQLQELEDKKAKLESDREKIGVKLLEKVNKYEEKLKEIKEKYQYKIDSGLGDAEKFSSATAKLEDKLTKKSEEIREKLLEKSEKLDSRTQKILDKINEGDYLGKKIGSSITSETYEIVFDSVAATKINDQTQTSSLSGFMSFTTFDKSKSNLKLELQECQITVDDVPYNCGFGKARTTSSGDSSAKDSLVILAFLEDDVLEEIHSTLKIFLNANTPISDIDGSSQVSILGPQSKISGIWFLDGTGTLTKIVSELGNSTDDSTDDSTDNSTDDSTDNEISVELTEEVNLSEN